MPVRTQQPMKPSAKTSARRAATKIRGSAKKIASKLRRATKSKRASAVVPAIEPPLPTGARTKPARRVGHAPLPTRRKASPALSAAGGGVAVPNRSR